MNKPVLVSTDIISYMANNYVEYASTTINDKRLRYLINQCGISKVIYGEDVLYHGPSRALAIEAWDVV